MSFFLLPVLWVFWGWGVFDSATVEVLPRESIRYAYLPSVGDYGKVADKQKEVRTLLLRQGILPGEDITLIERDPRTTPVAQRVARAGVVIGKEVRTAPPLLEGQLPPRQAVVVKVRAHPVVAYGKTYKALLDYLQAHGMSLRLPVVETLHDSTLSIEMALPS
ncbi:MAG: ferrous iron transport protein A [Methylophilaceae bacterium]|nr:ferrous iron transport protein A [Methylophilaceae bacterium]